MSDCKCDMAAVGPVSSVARQVSRPSVSVAPVSCSVPLRAARRRGRCYVCMGCVAMLLGVHESRWRLFSMDKGGGRGDL